MATTPTPRRPPLAVSRLASRVLGRFVLSSELSFEQQRARLAMFIRMAGPPKGATVSTRALGGIETSQVTTAASQPDTVVVHLHGGGYVVGEPAMGYGWAAQLADGCGATVLLPDYRLAPEAPFPAALEDVADAWKDLTATLDPRHIVLSGDSAGAGLALSFAARLRDQQAPLPAGLVLISPWLDLTADRRADPHLVRKDLILDPDWLAASATAYAAGTGLADPGISPLLGSVAGLPPVLVQAGADDVLVSDALRFARAAEEAGGDVTLSIGNDLFHDFPMQAGMLAAADSAIRQTALFVERVTAPAGS